MYAPLFVLTAGMILSGYFSAKLATSFGVLPDRAPSRLFEEDSPALDEPMTAELAPSLIWGQ